MKKEIIKLPLEFNFDSDFDTERFAKVRLKVMHNGLNRNNSNFNSDVIEAARPTLQNVPLLAFVKKTDGEEESDFAGHEFEIKITKDDELKYVYLGRPIGVIPESNNYEYVEDESGKKFVYVDAYVWKSYANEAYDILAKAGKKKVSMEVMVEDYDYEDGFMDIKKYSYDGVCLLGDDVQEGMLGAKAEVVNFTQDTFSRMVSELKETLKGGEKEMTIEKKKFEKEDPKDEKKKVNFEEGEEKEEPKEEPKEDPIVPSGKKDPEEEPKKEVDPVQDRAKLDEKPPETKETEDFSKENEQLKEKIAEYELELETLRKFQADTIKKAKEEAVDSLFSNFKELESVDEFSSLKEKAMEMNLSDLETQLYALKGKHGKFSFQADEEDSEKEKPQKEWMKLIKQYSHKSTDEPSWASIVNKNKEE